MFSLYPGIPLTMLRCNRNLLPVAVLEEGKSHVDERWHFTWGKHLCLCSTGASTAQVADYLAQDEVAKWEYHCRVIKQY